MKKIISLQNVKCRCPKNNPILERQSLLQLVQTKQEGRDEVEATLSLRRALFPAVCRDSSLSAKQMPLCTDCRQLSRSSAAGSQTSGSMLHTFMSRLQTSLNLSMRRPGRLEPVASLL